LRTFPQDSPERQALAIRKLGKINYRNKTINGTGNPSEKSQLPDCPIPDAYWVIPGRLLAGRYPRPRSKTGARQRLQRFLDAGVTLFLDLTEEEDAPPYAHWLGEEAQHLRIPIPDFGISSPEQMAQTLDVIDAAIGTGHTVYVHCLGGLGRTGTVVGCFLVRHGLSGAQALETIQLLRRTTPNASSPSPETDMQRWMVLNWQNGS